MQTESPIEALQKSNPAMVMTDLPEDFDNQANNFFRVMDKKAGDYKVVWTRTNPDEAKLAKKTFDELKTKGYAAYTVGDDGEQGEKIDKWDVNIERLIMVPPVQTG